MSGTSERLEQIRARSAEDYLYGGFDPKADVSWLLEEHARMETELAAHGIDPSRCDELGEHVRKNMMPDLRLVPLEDEGGPWL